MSTTFEDAKVGDRVWSIRHGWGLMVRIMPDEIMPIRADFDGGYTDSYTFDGKDLPTDKHQTLFWDEVKIVPPEKPKKWVTKEAFYVGMWGSHGKVFDFPNMARNIKCTYEIEE